MAHVRSGVRRGRSFSSAPRRQTSWTAGPGDGTISDHTVSLSTGSKAIWSTGLVPLVEGLTIGRIRGELLVYLKSATAQVDGFVGAAGILLVSDEAFAAGVASIPGPITDLDFNDWMWFQMFSIKSGGAIAAAAATDEDQINATVAAARYPIDSKAMRKFPVGKVMVGVIEVLESLNATMDADIALRTLVFLP